MSQVGGNSLGDSPRRRLADDRLGRKQFCELLATNLLLPPDASCRVVSVEGAWGEGKSSSIEMALDVMGLRDADIKPFVVRLNPWQLGTSTALTHAMLAELALISAGERRKEKNAAFADLAKKLLEYSNAVALLKTEPTSLVLMTIAKYLLVFASRLGKGYQDLEKKKERISVAIEKVGRPVIVVIDDVDRLLPAELVEVIRFVRSVANFRRTTYVLAFDNGRVVESLEKGGVPSADKFLEKIVQLRLHLPPIKPRFIRVLLDEYLGKSEIYIHRRLFLESEARRMELFEFHISGLLRDVRALIRVMDRLNSLPVALTRDVEFWDVFAMTVIAVQAPALFDLIRENPDRFAAGEYSTDRLATLAGLQPSSQSDDLEQRIKSTIEDKPLRTSKIFESLLGALFPQVVRKSGKPEQWLEHNGRVAAWRPLATYLAAGLEETLIPLDAIVSLLENAARRPSVLDLYGKSESSLAELAAMAKDDLSTRNNLDGIVDSADLASQLMSAWVGLKLGGELGEQEVESPTLLLPLLSAISAKSTEQMRILNDVEQRDTDGVLFSSLLESVLMPVSNIGAQPQRFPDSSEIQMFVSAIAERVTRGVASSSPNLRRMGSLLFSLLRIDSQVFKDVVSKMAKDVRSRRSLLGALSMSVYSGAHGQLAVWPKDLVHEIPDIQVLRDEAKLVLEEPNPTPELRAASMALIHGGQYIVKTGQQHRN